MTNTDYSGDALVEQPAIALFNQLDYGTANETRRVGDDKMATRNSTSEMSR